MTFGFSVGSENFRKLLSVSWEVFVLHGYDWIHRVAKSCTTTEYRWLFRDSHPSLRTSWSAVIKSPNFSAWGAESPVRLLQGALVILVRLHTSQLWSFGKWQSILCFLGATFIRRSGSESWEMFAGCWHVYDLEVLCGVLQPFGNTQATVSSSFLATVSHSFLVTSMTNPA